MPQTGRYFDTIQYTESQYAEVQNRFIPEGVIRGVSGELSVAPGGGMIARIQPGEAFIQGFWYKNDTAFDIVVPGNTSGSNRIDAIALRLNRATNQITLVHIPNSNLTAPVRSAGGDWEMRLSTLTLPTGTTTTLNAGMFADTRSGQYCGYTGPGIVQRGASRQNVSVTTSGEVNTGLNIPIGGTNQVELIAGGAYQVIAVPTALYLGTDPVNTAVQIGRVGMYTSVLGYLYVSPSSGGGYNIVNVQDGQTGQISIQNQDGSKTLVFGLATANGQFGVPDGAAMIYTAGTKVNNLYLAYNGQYRMSMEAGGITFWGQQTSRGYLSTNGQWVLGGGITSQSVLTVYNWLAPDHGINITAANNLTPCIQLNNALNAGGATAMARFGLVLQNGHLGATNFGDVWINNSGASAGWLRLGTDSIGRLLIKNTAASGGIEIAQGANTQAGSLLLRHTNNANTGGIGLDAAGRLVLYMHGGVAAHWIHPTIGYTTIGGSAPTDSAMIHIQQPSSGPEGGIRWTSGSGNSYMWVDQNFWLRINAASNAGVALIHGGAYFTPPTDQATNLGHPSYRWANFYGVHGTFGGNLGVSGGLTVSGLLTANGGISGLPDMTNPTFNNVTSNGTAFLSNLAGPGGPGGGLDTTVYPVGNFRVNFGGNGRGWGNIFSQVYWKPGGGNGFNDTNSDDRTKLASSFRPYDRGLDVVLALQTTYYEYNGEYGTDPGIEHVGFRAQQLQEVAPEMVFTVMRTRYPDDPECPEEELLSVNSSNLIHMHTVAIQELHAQLEALRAEIADLRAGRN